MAWTALGNTKQFAVPSLVDRYGLSPGPMPDLIVEYLTERAPSVDYATLEHMACILARLFWREVELIDPEQADLSLPAATAAEWKRRLAVCSDGSRREEFLRVLFVVRGFYKDIQQWALEDPARWGRWAAPCPISDNEARGANKERRRREAKSHQRTRALAPCCPSS